MSLSPRARRAAMFLLILALLSISMAAASTRDAAALANGIPVTVAGIEFAGEVTFPTGYEFAGTEVGGISGVAYDAHRAVYYALSDDQGQIDPARFYTLAIDLSDGHLDAGDITFEDVTTLLNEDGMPYPVGSLDPESITLVRPGQLYISSEGIASASPPINPFINRYNPDGKQNRALPVPAKFLPAADGSSGVRNNLAFESLTMTPNRRYLVTAGEGALAQDGPAANVDQESLARILVYDLKEKQAAHEFVYVVDPVAEEPDPPGAFRVNGLVELLALDDSGTFLALERSFSVGRGNTVKLYEIHTDGATDVAAIADLYDETTGTAVPFIPVAKRFLLDFADLKLSFPVDNLETLTLAPPLADGRVPLLVASDNNFSPGQVTQFIGLNLSLGFIDGPGP